MPESALDQLLKLRQQQQEREEKLFSQAKDELFAAYSDLKEKFSTLGIAMPGGGGSPAKSNGTKRHSNPDRPCPYCKVTGHDGRAHRSQKTKKAFTKDELAALA